MTTDPLSDMLARLKNAGAVNKEEVVVPHSTHLEAVAEVLKKCGYVDDATVRGDGKKEIILIPAYNDAGAKIKGAKRISRPSRRVYVKYSEIGKVKGGYGHLFVSTPQGIMTGDEAQEKKVGGEALFEIW